MKQAQLNNTHRIRDIDDLSQHSVAQLLKNSDAIRITTNNLNRKFFREVTPEGAGGRGWMFKAASYWYKFWLTCCTWETSFHSRFGGRKFPKWDMSTKTSTHLKLSWTFPRDRSPSDTSSNISCPVQIKSGDLYVLHLCTTLVGASKIFDKLLFVPGSNLAVKN